MRHSNIAIFIPHVGCRHRCVFCEQNKITGAVSIPSSEDVFEQISQSVCASNSSNGVREIAFFGGSFTAIPREKMISLLDVAYSFVKTGRFQGIRISTRPDAIDEERLSVLKEKGVTSIELGAQSMDDFVLKGNKRGHTRKDVIDASRLIRKFGFSLGLQMMTGMYRSTIEQDYYSALEIVNLKPDTVRIYPTVVMKGTKLAELYYGGDYVPYSFQTTVDLCCQLLVLFRSKNIQVIRLGLHANKSLMEERIAGAWHPAFREICESNLLLKSCIDQLNRLSVLDGEIWLRVHPCSISKLVGQRRKNITILENMGYRVKTILDQTIEKDVVLAEKCG